MHQLGDLATLDTHQKSTLSKAGLYDAFEVLLADIPALHRKLGLKYESQTRALIESVRKAVCPVSVLVSEAIEQDASRWMSTGDDDLDRLLGGGVRRGMITEIAGESAAGKSHLCLQLAVTAQVGSPIGNAGGTLFLTSEGRFPHTRLNQLVHNALCRRKSSSFENSSAASLSKVLNNIHTWRVADVDGLYTLLHYIVPRTIREIAQFKDERSPIRLLIVDSIAALFRASFENNLSGLSERSKMLCQIADQLKVLAEEFDLAVVVTNQVSDVIDRAKPINSALIPAPTASQFLPPLETSFDLAQISDKIVYAIQAQYFSGKTPRFAKEASLGLVWANAVNIRIMLSRTGRRRQLDDSDLTRKKTRIGDYEKETMAEEGVVPSQDVDFHAVLVRQMHLVFSPFAPERVLDYVILESGIHALPGTLREVARHTRHKRVTQSLEDDDDEFEQQYQEIPDHLWQADDSFGDASVAQPANTDEEQPDDESEDEPEEDGGGPRSPSHSSGLSSAPEES